MKKLLNLYDLVLIDDKIPLLKGAKELGGPDAILRKRQFPFPIKIHGESSSTLQATFADVFATSHFLLTGGQDFIIKAAKTESMSEKQAVKNVMHGVYRALTLIFMSQRKVKHNNVKEITLSTTKSIGLTIFEKEGDDEK